MEQKQKKLLNETRQRTDYHPPVYVYMYNSPLNTFLSEGWKKLIVIQISVLIKKIKGRDETRVVR